MTTVIEQQKALRPHPTNPNWTMPKSWGVWKVSNAETDSTYRYGNNPVRGNELRREFEQVELVALFLSRKLAKAEAEERNSE